MYCPTHQLFFSAPAVYLVVWKPREGSQAGQVKEWIQLVKRQQYEREKKVAAGWPLTQLVLPAFRSPLEQAVEGGAVRLGQGLGAVVVASRRARGGRYLLTGL